MATVHEEFEVVPWRLDRSSFNHAVPKPEARSYSLVSIYNSEGLLWRQIGVRTRDGRDIDRHNGLSSKQLVCLALW